MVYEPSYPYPCLDTIDPSDSTGNVFKCLINPRDTVTKYIIEIKPTDLVGLETTLNVVYTIKGELVSGGQKKYIKEGTDSFVLFDLHDTFDTTIPLRGSPNDDSWLMVYMPPNSILTSGRNYVWTITLYNGSEHKKSREYYFYARTNPTVTLNTNATYDSCQIDVTATYSQAENVQINYFKYNLYIGDKLVHTTGDIFSSNLQFVYDKLLNDTSYTLELIVTMGMGKVVTVSDSFEVAYERYNGMADIVLSSDMDKSCVRVNYSNQIEIKGIITGNQDVTFKKFKNPNETAPITNNAVSLDYSQALYWNKAGRTSLNLDKTNQVLHWHGHEGFSGLIFQKIDEESPNNQISIWFDGFEFKYQFGNAEILSYSPFTGGTASAIVHSGDSTDIDETKLYLLNDTDTLLEDDTLITNDITYNYWWLIIIKESSVEFIKSKNYTETVVSE